MLLQQLDKKTYFKWNEKLFYVVDAMPERDFFLIEDCITLNSRWMTQEWLETLEGMEVIKPDN